MAQSGNLADMSERPKPAGDRRHPWPRFLVRARRAWFGFTETVSFFAAVTAAVGRFLFGRWPEPAGRDYLAPKSRSSNPATEANPIEIRSQ